MEKQIKDEQTDKVSYKTDVHIGQNIDIKQKIDGIKRKSQILYILMSYVAWITIYTSMKTFIKAKLKSYRTLY